MTPDPVPASKLRQKILESSESRYRRLFEAAQDGILLLNADSAQIEDVNPYLIDMLGYTHAEFLGKKLWEVGAFADVARNEEKFSQLQTEGFVRYDNLPLKTKSGSLINVEFVSNSYDCEGIKVIQCNIRNITDRVAAEAYSHLRTRLYAALSECNQAIVHCTSAEELFPKICKTAVQRGGMKMACIGILDAESSAVQVVASFGDDTGYLQQLNISVDESRPSGRSPISTAIRNDASVWNDGIETDPLAASWRARRARFGFLSSGSLPLHTGGAVVGAFTVYSDAAVAFDEFTRDLLLEMATDISFALDGFAHETTRRHIAQELHEIQQRLQGVLTSAMDAILTADEQGVVILRNPAAARMFGYASDEFDRLPLSRLMPERFRAAHFIQVASFGKSGVTNRKAGSGKPIPGLRRNGDEFPMEVAISVDHSTGRPLYTAIIRDVTERERATAALQKSRERLMLATKSAKIGIWDWAVPENHMVWDAQMYALYGIRASDFSGAYSAWQAGLHPDDRARGDAAIAAGLDGSKEFNIEFRVVWPTGEVRDIEGHAVVQRAPDGSPMRMIGVNRDITDRKRSDQRIRYLNRVFAVLSGINALIVRMTSREQLYAEACDIAVDIGGFRMALIVIATAGSRTFDVLASAAQDHDLLEAVKDELASPGLAGGTMVARAIRTGTVVVSNDLNHDPQDLQGTGYAQRGIGSVAVLPLVLADKAIGAIALYAGELDFFHPEELKLLQNLAGDIVFAVRHLLQQERLEYLAYFDELTELPNRIRFIERVTLQMTAAAERSHRLVVLIIDLERFRNINVSLGREAGDVILKQVAQWLTQACGTDGLARVGPDQFALAMPAPTGDQGVAQQVVQLMDAFAQQPFRCNEAVFRIAARAGVALFPDDGRDAETLVRHAARCRASGTCSIRQR